MGYQERVLARISESSERQAEKTQVWDAIVAAYEQGGSDLVAQKVASLIDAIRTDFDGALRELQASL